MQRWSPNQAYLLCSALVNLPQRDFPVVVCTFIDAGTSYNNNMSRIGPVTVQIVRNRVSSLMEEMDYRFYRSGYSTIVRESRDFSCVVTDQQGRLAVAPPMFFHSPVYFHLIQRILEVYGIEGLTDGDTIVCNHPYDGNLPHLPDMALVTPVFHGSMLVAFTASIAHKADMGGAVPGSTWGQATELFQEGLLLPPVKIVKAGAPNTDLERLITGNSRAPELVLGDMHAQIGVIGIGSDGVKLLCDRFGADGFVDSMDEIIAASDHRFRSAITSLPNGEHASEGFLDSDGVSPDPVKLHVRVQVQGGKVHCDFSGSAPQTDGPANLRLAMVEACVFYSLIGFLDPSIPYSDAARDVISFEFGTCSVLNPDPPAPCSSYMKTCHKLVDVMLQALEPFLPGRAIANAGGSGGSIVVTWQNAAPGRGNQYEIFGSSYGAGKDHDGAIGVTTHLANLYATPLEIIESEFPCRITGYDIVPDSGGPGEWRGGLSFRRDYELLDTASVVYRADRARIAPSGLAGGQDGAKSGFLLSPGTPQEEQCPSSFRKTFAPGTRFSLQTAGGGGYGDPSERDPAALASDLAEGYVTLDAAKAVYNTET
ncbi:MAG: hydantoinase B/oxoprolinase family protein [Pseudomonadota bacterium]|nr:hydantoinase B/oxoprolinase family protein [Pseudomonadota bacterium]